MKLIVSAFLAFMVSLHCMAQEYNYYHYDVRDGLNGNTIYSIAQDKDGFIWMGTETGLTRFDGSHFKNYANNEGLYDNEIINLFVDSKNRIWIFPFKNAVYYYYQGKIYNKSNDPLLRRFNLRNEIFKACEDKKGNIFFLEHKKIHILTNKNEVIEIDTIQNKSFIINTCGIAANGNSNTYLSFEKRKDYSFHVFEYKDSGFTLLSNFQDSNFSRNSLEVNPYFTVIRNGPYFVITDFHKKKQYKLRVPKDFHTLSYINDSCVAISTLNKTLLYNIRQRQFIDSFLIRKLTNRCMRDKENNLWFATMTEGVYRLSSTEFKIYRLNNDINTLPAFALNATNKYLYIGSDKNLLWTLNFETNTLKPIPIQSKYTITRISNIQLSGNDSLIFGSNIGLFRYYRNKVSVCLPEASIKSSSISENSIVIATDRAAFDLSKYECHKRDTIWGSRATCAIKTNNEYYVGTLNGLYAVKNNAEHSVVDIGKNFPVLKDKIIAISATTDKTVWVATESNGMVAVKNNKLIYQLTMKNGLPSNVCRCIYIDSNKVWVGTNKGISKINTANQQLAITNFTAADGLDCEIINCIYTRGDSVFAGTPFGISFFRDSRINNQTICNIKLLDVQSKKNNWYHNLDSMHLESNDNFLRFEYAGISFMSAGNITYYYQLKGFSNEWQSTKQNIVEFQSLRPGDYQFNLYAVNKYGVKSKTISVSFTKEKPFWQQWWIWGLVSIILVALTSLAVKTRIRKIKESANKEVLRARQLHDLEQMAMRSQMNPHFVFNSLNSIQQYIFTGDVIEANRFITDFSTLVRQTFYISSKKFIPLEEEIKYLESYLTLEQVKYEQTFSFKIVTSGDVEPDIPIPPLLVQPFVENSIRHGVLNLETGQGEIFVYFSIKNNHLLCIVEDNGIGRETAKKLKAATASTHQSKGMELVQKRIESLNIIYKASIKVIIEDLTANNKTGTRVIIKLPLSYDEQ